MKYGRKVDYSSAKDGSDIRLADVYEIPPGEVDADAFLSRAYAGSRAAWVADGQWFVSVPDDSESGRGVNLDGTLKAAVVAPGPSGRRPITRDELLALMRAVDQAAFTGAITDPKLSYFFDRISVVETYHVDAPEMLLGLSLMVALGHWTQGQSDAFVASWPVY